MKREPLTKHLLIAGILALAIYAIAYAFIQHRREVKGPWRVEFRSDEAGVPSITIHQPALNITNVTIVFADERAVLDESPRMLVFDDIVSSPPYEVPFGEVIYFDTTFLPGVVTFNLFTHEIELLPRVLIINRQQHPWQSNATIPLTGTGKAAPFQKKQKRGP
jgi:hypothetical protein